MGVLTVLVQRRGDNARGTAGDRTRAGIVLCTRYAMPGTDVAYAATRRQYASRSGTLLPLPPYAVPGTDIAHAGTTLSHTGTTDLAYPGTTHPAHTCLYHPAAYWHYEPNARRY
eukprot:3501125-Rhodomonas_salina.2